MATFTDIRNDQFLVESYKKTQEGEQFLLFDTFDPEDVEAVVGNDADDRILGFASTLL